MALQQPLLSVLGILRQWGVGDFLSYLGLSGDAPATPPAGEVRLFGREAAGRTLPAYVSQDGRVQSVQPDLVKGGVLFWRASDNLATLTSLGGTLPSPVGTATIKVYAPTTSYTRHPMPENLVATAAATAVAGFYRAGGSFRVCSVGGPSADVGGFYSSQIWGPGTGVAVATHRAFCGLGNSIVAPTDVQPSTQIDCVGMGWDAADTNIQMMHNDATGACTKIDLGASFPVPVADRTNAYRLEMYSPPGTTQVVNYTVTNLETGAEASGQITTNMPAAATLLAPRGYCSVGGTSSVVGIGTGTMFVDRLL